MEGVRLTKAWQARGVESFAKTALIQQLVDRKANVCEISSKAGSEIGKFERARIRSYVSWNELEQDTSATRARWREKGCPFASAFVTAPMTIPSIRASVGQSSFEAAPQKETPASDTWKADAVVMFNNVDEGMGCSRERTQCLLKNVAGLLSDNGYFFGIAVDSAEVWKKAQRSIEEAEADRRRMGEQITYIPQVLRELYKLDFAEGTTFEEPFGTEFLLTIEGEGQPNPQFLIPWDEVIDLANEEGLELVEITNMLDFFDEYKKSMEDVLKAFRAIDSRNKRVLPEQRDLVGMWCLFVFRRKASTSADSA